MNPPECPARLGVNLLSLSPRLDSELVQELDASRADCLEGSKRRRFGGIQRRVNEPCRDSEAQHDANEDPALRTLTPEDCIPQME